MKKIPILALILSTFGSCLARADSAEVETLIKCEDGSDITNAAQDLNYSINVSKAVYANITDGTMVVIKAPFTVSAPAIYVESGHTTRLCVTITKASNH